MSPLLRSGLAINQETICSHSPAKGSLWVRHQPSTVFSAPAPGTGCGALFDLLRVYALAHLGSLGQLGLSGASFALYFIAFDLVSMVVFSLTTTIRMLLGLIRPTQGGGR